MNRPGAARRPGVRRGAARRWRGLTLRARLTSIAAAAVAVAVVGVSVVAFVAVGHQVRASVDQTLRRDAETVAAAPGEWAHRGVLDGDDDGRGDPDHDHDLSPRVQVLDGAGRPVRATGLPVTGRARRIATGHGREAFEQVPVHGADYRMLTRRAAGGGAVQVAVSLHGARETMTGVGLAILVVGAIGVAAAAALGALVARAGLRPVDRLTAAVEHVTATADLDTSVDAGLDASGRDEVGRLAAAFNTMLAALRSSRAAQRLLVEDAGHELRTPLTSLRTNIQLLIRADRQRDRQLSDADRGRLLADLDAQTTELTRLVGELVNLARDDHGAELVEPVDLAELVDLAVQRLPAGTPVDADYQHLSVPGRATSLTRMVANLLDNAVKWSPPGAPVTVRLRAATGADGAPGAELSVADRGPGVAEADLPHIFERFHRAPTARSVPGSGLGLAIVAQAVALHAGNVRVEPVHPTGARFVVWLPS
ncbi:HAMP domain-containing sensor histidine kinase [Actinocatenispora comari]|uniref:histidine kinase n=1 Tax=Actinocatenispora comari TaxID=2807577 RepID=A0A8J4AE30_9ACTN|nr:HAMP domain-containing sensor histidine kinase [Actinocatenispora comari]GIL27935.1 two-component sensor histidine kinase [Actinocatenispora comari]